MMNMTEEISLGRRLRAYFNVSTVLFVGCFCGVLIGYSLAIGDVCGAYMLFLLPISCVGIVIITTEIEYRRKVKKIDP